MRLVDDDLLQLGEHLYLRAIGQKTTFTEHAVMLTITVTDLESVLRRLRQAPGPEPAGSRTATTARVRDVDGHDVLLVEQGNAKAASDEALRNRIEAES